MTDVLLYAATVVLWGTSWLGIKFQLGVVAPEVSIVYRSALASVLIAVWCVVARRGLRFRAGEHAAIALQGLLLFSANYVLIYLATQYLASGLVAVVFSLVAVLNMAGAAILFGTRIGVRAIMGAALGISGLTLVFWPEIRAFDLDREGSLGLALALVGTATASAGMLTSAANQRHGLAVAPTNALGMAYGTAFVTLYVLAAGRPWSFDPSPVYVVSLAYLAVGASALGFACYLTLVGRIGAGPAGYATVLFPVVALALSTLVEGFHWTAPAGAGVVMVLVGNALVLSPARSRFGNGAGSAGGVAS